MMVAFFFFFFSSSFPGLAEHNTTWYNILPQPLPILSYLLSYPSFSRIPLPLLPSPIPTFPSHQHHQIGITTSASIGIPHNPLLPSFKLQASTLSLASPHWIFVYPYYPSRLSFYLVSRGGGGLGGGAWRLGGGCVGCGRHGFRIVELWVGGKGDGGFVLLLVWDWGLRWGFFGKISVRFFSFRACWLGGLFFSYLVLCERCVYVFFSSSSFAYSLQRRSVGCFLGVSA
jgi:hypothetical protein